MISFKTVDRDFLENSKQYFGFNIEVFCNELRFDKTKKDLYSLETLKQLFLLNENTQLEDNVDLKDVDSYGADYYKNNYYVRKLLETYLLRDDYFHEDINEILLKVFINFEKEKAINTGHNWHYSLFNKENSKKLMRVIKISNEFYLNNIEYLGKYYNILKRNNPELKEDGIKLVNEITIQKPTLLDELDKKYNLSSKQVFTLPPSCLITHTWHFSMNALKRKYPDELKKMVKDLFMDKGSLENVRNNKNRDIIYGFNLFEYVSDDDPDFRTMVKNFLTECYEEISTQNNSKKNEIITILNFINQCCCRCRSMTRNEVLVLDVCFDVLKDNGVILQTNFFDRIGIRKFERGFYSFVNSFHRYVKNEEIFEHCSLNSYGLTQEQFDFILDKFSRF